MPPPPQVRTEPVELPKDTKAYVEAAVNAELKRLDNTTTNRNDQLNKAAFTLGEFVGAGALDRDWAVGALARGAYEIGLPLGEARRTIKSGLDAGTANPRRLNNG